MPRRSRQVVGAFHPPTPSLRNPAIQTRRTWCQSVRTPPQRRSHSTIRGTLNLRTNKSRNRSISLLPSLRSRRARNLRRTRSSHRSSRHLQSRQLNRRQVSPTAGSLRGPLRLSPSVAINSRSSNRQSGRSPDQRSSFPTRSSKSPQPTRRKRVRPHIGVRSRKLSPMLSLDRKNHWPSTSTVRTSPAETLSSPATSAPVDIPRKGLISDYRSDEFAIWQPAVSAASIAIAQSREAASAQAPTDSIHAPIPPATPETVQPSGLLPTPDPILNSPVAEPPAPKTEDEGPRFFSPAPIRFFDPAVEPSVKGDSIESPNRDTIPMPSLPREGRTISLLNCRRRFCKSPKSRRRRAGTETAW